MKKKLLPIKERIRSLISFTAPLLELSLALKVMLLAPVSVKILCFTFPINRKEP